MSEDQATETIDDFCPNCGAALASKYCPDCGQKRIDKHEFAVGHFFGHLFHEITHLDSNKILRTFGHLIAKPGLLTRAYLAGRKGIYLTPIRVYLTVSALYFLFAWGALASAGGGSVQENEARPYMVELAKRKGEDVHTMAVMVQEKAAKYAGFGRFASVLASGLFLMVLYRGTGRYYVEHLIFSLHFYSFDFLAKCVVAVIYLISGQTAVFHYSRIAYYLLALVYLFFALRLVYSQSWLKTGVKATAQFAFEVGLFIFVNIVGFVLAVALA